MKKLLLTTTALTLSAGVAAADVSLSGDARMGITNMSRDGDGNAITDGTKTQFTNRARVIFTLSGETDTGLTFGGSFRADNAGAAADGTGGSVFISGEFGKLSFGDVNSGDKAIVGNIGGASSFGQDFNDVTWIGDGSIGGFVLGMDAAGAAGATGIDGTTVIQPVTLETLGTDDADNTVGQAARVLYEYGIDGFNFAASASQQGDNSSYGIGASYEMNGFSIAAGYAAAEHDKLTIKSFNLQGVNAITDAKVLEATELLDETKLKATQASLKLGYTFDATTVQALGQSTVVKAGSTKVQSVDTIGLSVGTTFDQIGLSAYAKQDSTKTHLLINDKVDTNSFGVQASYDLGGGATASIAYNSRQIAGGLTVTQAELDGDDSTAATISRAASKRQNVIEAGLSFSF